MNITQLNEKLKQLLENKELDSETKQILTDLEKLGYKHFILRYTRMYDIVYEGKDEDGYPDFSYEYYDDETDTYNSLSSIGKIDFDLKKEGNRILLGTDEDKESGDYPSGGTPDHIIYTSYNNQYRNRYYLIGYSNKVNELTLVDYILERYPNSKLASLIKQTNIVDEGILEDLKDEDFE